MAANIRRIDTESDNHGAPCDYCALEGRFCIANVYYVDEQGDEDTTTCCQRCIPDAIRLEHFGDDEPLVEISNKPLPKTLPAAA